MKKLVFNVLAIMLATVVHNSLAGADIYHKDYEKLIKKEFAISSDGLVRIKNSYGKVKINPTDGNEVRFEITLKVDKNSESKAEEFFDNIDIEFTDSSSEVTAVTDFGGNNNKSSWTSWLNPKNWNSSNNYSINYEVWMPASCKLYVINRYGDVFIGDMENNVKLELAYCDGIMNDIDGDLHLDLAYGDCKVGEIKDLELDIRYGELKCKAADDVEADSRYSDVYIDEANKINSETGYDDYFLGRVNMLVNDGAYDDFTIDFVDEIEFDSRYTDYVIKELGSGGSFDSGYGDLKVSHVQNLSRGLDIEGSYSDVILGIDFTFNIDIESKYTDVKLPSSIKDHKNYSREKDGSELNVRAKSVNTKNNITAEMRYGSFKIRGNY